MRVSITIVLFLSLITSSAISRAEDDRRLGALAVQNRQHTLSHEFGVWAGSLPLDAFTKGVTFSGGYTLHFNDVIAWEVGQFTYSLGVDTDLKEDLKNLPQPVGPTPFEVVDYFATTSLVVKPVYGKMALLNRSLIFGELFAVLGGGYGRMTLTTRPVVNFGGGMRVYAGRYLSVRLDVRDYLFVNLDDVHQELWVALGISLGIP